MPAVHPVGLARWQWSDYASFHGDRRNLWIHLGAVPLFLVGNLLAVAGAVLGVLDLVERAGDGLAWYAYGSPVLLMGPGLLVSLVAMALQGKGHGLEATPPVPFTGFGNALGRIFLEQWWTFPRFVLTGGWLRALRS